MSDKIFLAGASWCSYTNKQINEMKEAGLDDKIEIIDCSKDKGHEVCKGVTGFPTFKNSAMEVCQVGYTTNHSKLLSDCSTNSS